MIIRIISILLIILNENVFRLQITMNNTRFVYKFQGNETLLGNLLNTTKSEILFQAISIHDSGQLVEIIMQ